MSYIEEQLRNVDDYGYPMPPSTRRKVRKSVIRTSIGIIGTVIYLLLSIIGCLLWLGRRGKRYPRLTHATSHPKRLLSIRLDLITDLDLSLAVVRAQNA